MEIKSLEEQVNEIDADKVIHDDTLIELVQRMLEHIGRAQSMLDHPASSSTAMNADIQKRIQRHIDMANMYANAVKAIRP